MLFLSVLRLVIQVTCHREIWLKYSRSESLMLAKPSSTSHHHHSACGFATNGCRIMPGLCCYQRLLLFACFMQIMTENESRFSFFIFFVPSSLVCVISHSCFVSFVSISNCPLPLGLWGTTHTAIWPTTTTGWEGTPAGTTG